MFFRRLCWVTDAVTFPSAGQENRSSARQTQPIWRLLATVWHFCPLHLGPVAVWETSTQGAKRHPTFPSLISIRFYTCAVMLALCRAPLQAHRRISERARDGLKKQRALANRRLSRAEKNRNPVNHFGFCVQPTPNK